MRYLSSPTLEQGESQLLTQVFGKRYGPYDSVSIDSLAGLSTKGVELVPLQGETLAIQPDIAGWTFLTEREKNVFRGIDGHSYSFVADQWPGEAPDDVGDFVARLYRRGLLQINGRSAIDETIFEDSSNTLEGHLVELLLTEKCNLACGYCLAGAKPGMPTMTEEIAFKTIDLAFKMRHAPSLTFEFAGGEPFLKFDLMLKLVPYIREHQDRDGRPVHIVVQSNATLLTEERVKWLKTEGVGIGISIDGNPESHNLSRPQVNGKESFSKVIRGIDLLQRHDIPFGVLIVLNRMNVAAAQDLVEFLVDNDILSVKINPIAYLGRGRDTWDHFGLTPQEVTEYFIQFAQLLVKQGFSIIEDNLRTMMEYLVSKRRTTRCMRTHCGAGETFQTINAKGDIYPCGRSTQSPKLVIGNVLSEKISLSAPGEVNPYIQDIKNRRPRNLEGCPSCYYRQLCQAGCSAQAFERYGTVRHRTPECDFYKTMYPFLMRWLCFDKPAADFFNSVGYFGPGVEIVSHDYLPLDQRERIRIADMAAPTASSNSYPKLIPEEVHTS